MFNREQRELNRILTEQHKDAGLWLTIAPADPNVLNLIGPGGHVVKSFDARAVTDDEILKEADKCLEANNAHSM